MEQPKSPHETAETSLRQDKEARVPTPGETEVSEIQSLSQPEKWNKLRRAWNWKPSPARYDPENPPKFTIWLNVLFGFASCFTVTNLYYNQPILNRMAGTFNVSFERASSIATLMQAGYAGGLLLICPLGDIFPRRPFILGLITFTATLWLVLCLTTSFAVFAAVSFLTGFTTVTPQLMLPLVGDLAPAHRRASSLAVVVSGLSLGILVARILSGVLAEAAGAKDENDWRGIYWFGLGAQWLVLALLYIWMPDYPSKNPDKTMLRSYPGMLASIARLLVTEPLLLQAALVAFLLSAVFTSYWTTLSFLLASPPFGYSSLIIGLFGLIGVVVILAAPVYSRLVLDKIQPLVSAVVGLTLELVGVIVGTFTGSFHVAGPVVQAIAIDLGSQFTQIGNRAAIYAIQPKARNRVNTAYMLSAFSGQLTGTAVGNRLYAQGGWVYSGSCSIGFIALALIICVARGPRETGWVGWSGGWSTRRDDLPVKGTQSNPESPAAEAVPLDTARRDSEGRSIGER
ncbi:major facilitator superfamily domain-containing protein [Corynascus novoguineensis]|uniref:Major facilitator superfamily domain-containing protein n=1 Tax=Corynascus novoguineensis TaxID=1126955 RepID=A0AAN7HGR7_9PEZI|nr:major facilitator superfamily domain-containing protein [Corynascus novoguineensis]